MPPFDAQITFLYTRDLEGTARFYEQTLGLPLKLDQGSCRIYRTSPDGYLGFCQRADAPGANTSPGANASPGTDAGPGAASDHGAGQVILTLVTPEVDNWYERLRDRGVVFEKPPAENPTYRIYHCFLRDPNGYLIEIQRFLHPF
jgi:catechol 2,3-dioxygenase-like lactoylglutathione lyase family enzyme